MDNVSIAIIICTYKREQYVLKNIDVLKKYCKDVIKHVYVIDNGQTLDTKLSDDFIHIVPNKNLGGSGGYARGMYEAHKSSGCSHIFLMDDDIEFTPEVIHKAYDRLCGFSKEEKDDWIGFGMVTFDKPNVLYECGAYWGGIRAIPNNQGLDITSGKPLNDKLKYNYSAWWSLIMPISVIDKYGYPLPFFIKFDDTEYGLRRKNEKIHFYKDLYIKHKSFESKYNHLIDYYGLRNSLITNVIHFKFNFFRTFIKYTLNIFKRLFKLNLNAAIMCNKGLSDFLNGPSIFDKTIFFNIRQIDYLLIPFNLIINLFKILFRYNTVRERYKKKYKIIINQKYWESKFYEEI